jgi:hypothetical protein
MWALDCELLVFLFIAALPFGSWALAVEPERGLACERV